MKPEDKELLLKDLCSRLPYGLWVRDEESNIIYISYNDIHFENFFNGILNGNIKPYLRNMSDMTDEEEKEFQDINMYELPYRVEGLDWLNEHHFDYRMLIDAGLALKASEDIYKHEVKN